MRFQSDARNRDAALFTSAGDCKQDSEEKRKKCLSQDQEKDAAGESFLTSFTLTAFTKSGLSVPSEPITEDRSNKDDENNSKR